MKRIQIDPPRSNAIPKNISYYSFVGVLLLILPFTFFLNQREGEKGLQYMKSYTGCDTFISECQYKSAIHISVESNGALFLKDKLTNKEKIVSEVERQIREHPTEELIYIGIEPNKKSKMGDIVEIVDFLRTRYPNKIQIVYI